MFPFWHVALCSQNIRWNLELEGSLQIFKEDLFSMFWNSRNQVIRFFVMCSHKTFTDTHTHTHPHWKAAHKFPSSPFRKLKWFSLLSTVIHLSPYSDETAMKNEDGKTFSPNEHSLKLKSSVHEIIFCCFPSRDSRAEIVSEFSNSQCGFFFFFHFICVTSSVRSVKNESVR